jgi:hypothetical protein
MESATGHPPDVAVVCCAECGREADEVVALDERWSYWSDGRS